jgi:hypothetical protein
MCCDAERAKQYDRQFPDGPRPDFVAQRGNDDDLALLKTFTSPEALREIYGDGRSPEADAELTRRIDAARLTQAVRQALRPDEVDRPQGDKTA